MFIRSGVRGLVATLVLLIVAATAPSAFAASKVTVPSPSTAASGTTVALSGRVTAPRATGVLVQRAKGKSWHKLRTGTLRNKRYALTLELGPSVGVGALRLRVLARHGKTTLAKSKPITIKITAPTVPNAAASAPIDDEGGRGSLGGDYPDADAVDCSGRFGVYSWCKGGTWLSSRGYGYRNCVDYAAWVLGLPRGLGNAKDWKANAAKGKLTVTSSPSVGDVAWWGGGSFGHVAVVTAAYPSGAVDTVDYNGDGRGNKTRRLQTRADAYLHPGQPPAIIVQPGGGGGPTTQPAPDIDGDGTPDASDTCRTVAGPASSGGCPSAFTQVFTQGANNSLSAYWINPGEPWNGPAVPGGAGTSISHPASVVHNTSSFTQAFTRGPDNSLRGYWVTPGQPWAGPAVLNGAGTTYSAPAAVVEQKSGITQVFAQGPNNSLYAYWVTPGQPWNGPAVVAGPGTTFLGTTLGGAAVRSWRLTRRTCWVSRTLRQRPLDMG